MAPERRSEPTPGTKLRLVWEDLHENAGHYIELPAMTDHARHDLIAKLRHQYGLAIETDRRTGWVKLIL